MSGRKSITNQLFRLARDAANLRAARRGPAASAKRVLRRKVYRTEGTATRRVFRIFGL